MENRDISSNTIKSTAGGLDTAVYFVDEVEALQAEISRLEIAYKNATEQRRHYVKKCLELSNVILEFNDRAVFMQDRLSILLRRRTEHIDLFLEKHKELINELKHNIYLEVK